MSLPESPSDKLRDESSGSPGPASYDEQLRIVLDFIEDHYPVGTESEDDQSVLAVGGEPKTGGDNSESSKIEFAAQQLD